MNFSFRWNLAYADAYADLLWEENTIRSLKSTAEVVQGNTADASTHLWDVKMLSTESYYWTVSCFCLNVGTL